MNNLSDTLNDDSITLGFFTLNNEPIPVPPGLEASYKTAGAFTIAGDHIAFGSTIYRVAGKYFYYYNEPNYKVYLVRATRSETIQNTLPPTETPSADGAEQDTQRVFTFSFNDPDCPAYSHKGEGAIFAGTTFPRIILQKQFTDFTNSDFNITFDTAY
ncbi:hypothetical protein HX890_15720 [Pseudomonas gingeri]|uniref:hypothetical protein n=1 Tax=Pseudomonas gingeri TaxID=117681 RepID=UPI0015A262EF|nr:hypothetical protein [Pseudomonas gingeri]NWD75563.1 hypothetical protein [Pseudomonas gingeri]